jgi:SAM-dependent methyltransferase
VQGRFVERTGVLPLREYRIPQWAPESIDSSLFPQGIAAAWRDGILRYGDSRGDPAIEWYEAKGGTSFAERTHIPYTMSSLDTPIYHELLARLRPNDPLALIVDVGAGDGRNTLPFLEWGCKRVIAVDPVRASLCRLRTQADHLCPDAEERLLLVQADARRLPLLSECALLVLAIESLYYLNDDHALGLAECARLLGPAGRLLLSDRAWEGGLFTGLLYGGISELLRVGEGRSLRDGLAETPVQTRLFTEDELVKAVTAAGLQVTQVGGLSILSVVLGYIRGQGRISQADEQYLPDVIDLLKKLGKTEVARRAHVVVAERFEGPSGRRG